MKKHKEFTLEMLTIAFLSVLPLAIVSMTRQPNIDVVLNDTIIDTAYENEEEKFDSKMLDLAEAFAKVESNKNPNAVNGNCVGYLQISPICVKEVNNILKRRAIKELDSVGVEYDKNNIDYVKFTLADREDMYSSVAMFVILMDEKNPTCNIKKACKIWNPTAGEWYYKKVKKAYDDILKEYE